MKSTNSRRPSVRAGRFLPQGTSASHPEDENRSSEKLLSIRTIKIAGVFGQNIRHFFRNSGNFETVIPAVKTTDPCRLVRQVKEFAAAGACGTASPAGRAGRGRRE